MYSYICNHLYTHYTFLFSKHLLPGTAKSAARSEGFRPCLWCQCGFLDLMVVGIIQPPTKFQSNLVYKVVDDLPATCSRRRKVHWVIVRSYQSSFQFDVKVVCCKIAWMVLRNAVQRYLKRGKQIILKQIEILWKDQSIHQKAVCGRAWLGAFQTQTRWSCRNAIWYQPLGVQKLDCVMGFSDVWKGRSTRFVPLIWEAWDVPSELFVAKCNNTLDMSKVSVACLAPPVGLCLKGTGCFATLLGLQPQYAGHVVTIL